MATNNFQEFNKFQTDFYTDIRRFNEYTNFEIKRNSVMLLTNIGKGFPQLAMSVLDIYSPIVKAVESPAIIRALQRTKFCNGFSKTRIPYYVYYKSLKPKTTKKIKVTKVNSKSKKKFETFDDNVREKIQSILMLDNKDYEMLIHTDTIQNLGKQIQGQIEA